ncbi:DUF6916 family protein [Photobacterium kasasachensis]|uniref:DUF6916 family protein n=1 Tax=Photobacterium kasasachensis TaxID=2910240 RepID=UPI003D11F61B
MKTLDYDLFANTHNDVFNVSYDPEQPPLPLTLVEVSEKRDIGNDMESFSLLFQAPKSVGCLGQGTWAMENTKNSDLISLFIVPVGEDEEYFKYEAIISCKKLQE